MAWTLMFIVIAFILSLCLREHAKASEKIEPFVPGEKLTFQVKWSFIPAGEAVIEVLPVETLNGVRAYHFVMIARTNAFADLFYKVRDRIDAYTDTEMTHSILYKKRTTGKANKDVTVTFDWQR
jgi:hypothetical protein